ncbi:alpha/beta hydrolase-fold protein [Hymenobacter sp. YC55]|uniref:alpha/beta hydrolase n=1 Tax=Hymenobacter sp. YC55 TaxID=3034019 RepID=UPI0023F71EF5|nr:alpha/beta hydrolase-fold protein [Hymenobacter sp. YC55]MDF7813752.1 alpha/beta hydrolase-fold protein [Hymenobacter sp. YC55]
MKQVLLFLCSVLLSFPCHAQPGKQLVLGQTDSIPSTLLKEQRKFYVHVPSSASGKEGANKRYPVVYLFDADAQFAATTSLIQYLSTNYNTVCPEMIVVGLLHSDRRKDLTPTHVTTDPPFWAPGTSKTTGGGEKFIAFIEQELIPYIDRHYPTRPDKLLIGHSLGGLTVMQIFVHHTRLFNAYICIDPSMWWDKQTLLKETKRALEQRSFQGTALYLGIANTAEQDMELPAVRADTTAETLHMRSVLQLQRYLETNKHNGLKYQGKYYKDESHMSVPFITEYEALRFLFGAGRK